MECSFRDPSGFVFLHEGTLYRHVTPLYRDHYERFMQSGLYAKLADKGLIVSHEEVQLDCPQAAGAFRILKPRPVPFISYPYEWCFSQMKDAALATLRIQKLALDHGMTLKDGSAYNIQFLAGRPVLIDTLSFEAYEEGRAWTPYNQFCKHFVAPLALMAHRDIRLGQLARVFIDGVPLDMASRLLPWRTRLNFQMLAHIHLHAKFQARYADAAGAATGARPAHTVSKRGLLGLLDGLESLIRGLRWEPSKTEWAQYYQDTNYTAAGFEHKQRLVADFLGRAPAQTVWDLGSNNGLFSQIAAKTGAFTISADGDPAAVELNYLNCRRAKEERILPLLIDLTNPSPDLGWANRERDSFIGRGPADAVLALALIHHLAISNNVPLDKLADFFHGLGRRLVIEFVPKTDSQVRRLLASREDIFPNYTREGFEASFGRRFSILEAAPIEQSERTLYLMERRDS